MEALNWVLLVVGQLLLILGGRFARRAFAEEVARKALVPPMRDRFSKFQRISSCRVRRTSKYKEKSQFGDCVTDQQECPQQRFSMLSINTDLNAYVASVIHNIYTKWLGNDFAKCVRSGLRIRRKPEEESLI